MRIGTITFHSPENYGAVLQAYALQQYLKQFGEPEIINYHNYIPKKTVFQSVKSFLRPLKRFLRPSSYKQEHAFSNFRKQYINISPKMYVGDKEIKQNPPKYDVYIAGSDQIWNCSLTGPCSAYFLSFTNSPRKYAFAASVGHAHMTQEEKALAKEYLPSFAQIAVREKDTAAELETLLKRPVQTVLDPVFLLSKEEWENIFHPIRLPKGPYIAVYALQDTPIMHHALEYLKTLGLPLVFIGKKIGEYGKCIQSAGPREFLYILANSKYVVTNSFHGFSFSLIFQKQIFVCEHTSRNLRLENLLEQIGAADKQIHADTPDVSACQVDGKTAYARLDIQQGKDYLAGIFNTRNEM